MVEYIREQSKELKNHFVPPELTAVGEKTIGSVQWTEVDYKHDERMNFYSRLADNTENLQVYFDQNITPINEKLNPDLCRKSIFGNYRDLCALLFNKVDLTISNLKVLELGGGVSPLLYYIANNNPKAQCWSVDTAQYTTEKDRIKNITGIDIITGDAWEIDKIFAGADDFNLVYSNHLLSSSYPGVWGKNYSDVIEKSHSLLHKKSGYSIHYTDNYLLNSMSCNDTIKSKFSDFTMLEEEVLGNIIISCRAV